MRSSVWIYTVQKCASYRNKYWKSPCWTIHMIYCDTFTTHEVNIKSRGIDNGDGWNPDSSRNLMIFDTTFGNGDDCIAIKSGKSPDGNRVNIPTRNVRIFVLLSRKKSRFSVHFFPTFKYKKIKHYFCCFV